MKVLIIDDERFIRNSMKDILELDNHEVAFAENGKEGVDKALSETFDAIFCDIKMPVMNGEEVLDALAAAGCESPVIMISGHGDIETAVKCIKKGAYDFIQKPLDLNRILISLKNATDKTTLIKETVSLKKKIQSKYEIVGNSPAIEHIKEIVDRVAATDARVLIMGANGTGKELVARRLHDKSPRAAAPFVEVNCAAIPGELIESELFGHEKGAFTSAIKQHKGKFEQAEGGTLFLDEIGDMSLAAQAKVLRVLQERKISRVGSDKDITVNVRVVAATNKNLTDEIAKGTFREDLYHRLSVIVIHVPSLSERTEDIPLLMDYFIGQICQETGMARKKVTPEAIAELQKLPWTGNIRELRNVAERLMILCGPEITASDITSYATPSI
ncbi:MAG: sigma-54 dependent transcriptional regulator [Bacteroidales bacterium]|nr:sigma-54 dependent transcriptional regulator [Bacteroidales bacterium]